MKRNFRIISIVFVLAVLILCISGCAASDESKYKNAQLLLGKGQYSEAAEIFDALGSYEDSTRLSMYAKAVLAGESGDYETAFSAFRSLEDLKDSKQLLKYYEGRSYQASADSLIASENRDDLAMAKNDYDEATQVYSDLSLFKDCQTRLSACQSGSDNAQEKIHAYDYTAADKLEQDGKYEEAIRAFEALGSYSDSSERAKGAQEKIYAREYAAADKLEQDGKYEEAIRAFNALGNYSDSTERITKIVKRQYSTVGNAVAFGTYEQDNNHSNGAETIEWIVLAVQDKKSLLISRYGLDTHAYHSSSEDVTWETCELRSWLNGTFMNTAFSAAEQSAILMTTVDNSDRQGDSEYNTNGGNNTNDKLFPLSFAEAGKYFSNAVDRMCVPTDYAIAQGGYASNCWAPDGRTTCLWWLRSPGYYQYSAMITGLSGRYGSIFATNDSACVRPAFWLNLESNIF